MKATKRALSVLLSLLMLLSLMAAPLQALADDGIAAQALDPSAFEYDADSIVAEFKYQSDNTTLLAAPQTQSSGDGGKAYADVAQVDLTAYTYSNLYMQMDVDANQGLDMVIFQPFLNGDARNHVIYSDWPEVKTANSINGYYTLSIPMTNIELKVDSFSVYAPPKASFQWKNRKIVNMTRDDILAKLNGAIAAVKGVSADVYLDVTAIQAAATDAQASIDANANAATLMNKWNILRAQYHLLEAIPETAAEDLANILAEDLPEGAVYARDKMAAYEAAVVAGTVVNSDATATAGQKFAAYVAIRDAKEALGFNMEYQVIHFPPVNGSDENGVIQWTAGNNFHMSTLTNTVDVSDHNSAKLRFRVDLQLVSGDISGASLFVLQPRDENNQMQNGSNLAGILKETLTDNEWHTFERDLSASINAYPDTWHLLKYASFHLSGTNAVLNVRNMRLVDITMEEEKVALKSRIEGKTAPTDMEYPNGLVNGFNTAKEAALAVANSGEEVGTWAEVWAAEDGVDAAIAAFDSYKELTTLMETALPADKDYSAASLAVYNTAIADAEALLVADSMTNEQLTAAIKAIEDAKAALVDISYVVFTFPAAPGSDENGIKTWSFAGDTNYDRLAFDQSIDLTTRDKSKLRLQVDIQLAEGSASSIKNFTLQPVDGNNQTANVWDNSIKTLLDDGQWHTFEYNLGNFANLYTLKEVGMYCNASDITLKVGRFRIVDLSALEIKDELQALVNEGLDENKDYVAGTTDAYVAALAEAEALLADENTSLTALDGAIAAINAAKAQMQDITYLVADIPENGNDPTSQTATWTLPAGSEMQAYYSGILAQRVDLSGHKPENLRYRVDIRLTNADSFTFIQMTAQPRDNSNPQNFENDWDTNVVLQKDVWYTYERDFTLSINKANEGGVDWSKIIRSDLFAQYAAPESDVILEVRNMRVVDITLEGKKAELKAVIDTPVNDAAAYLPSTWEAYQTALTAANTAMGEDVIRFAPVEKAMADLQTAIDGLKPGFVYDETRSHVDVTFNDDQATLTVTPNEGYAFIGWDLDGEWLTETTVSVSVNDLTKIQPVVLNRQAGQEETMVCFYSKGNVLFDSQILTATDDIAAILEAKKAAAPSIFGYESAEWDTPADLILAGVTINITLNYTAKVTTDYTITVENAIATYIGEAMESGFMASFDSRVTVRAAGDGEFKYWILDGMVVSFNTTYTFYVSGNNTVKAVYAGDADYNVNETAENVRVQIKADYLEAMADGKYKWTVIPQIYQPNTYTVVEYGVIYAPTSRDLSDLSVLTEGYDYVKVSSSSNIPNRQFMVALRNIKDGAKRQAVAYLTVTSDVGTETYYSDAITVIAGEGATSSPKQ